MMVRKRIPSGIEAMLYRLPEAEQQGEARRAWHAQLLAVGVVMELPGLWAEKLRLAGIERLEQIETAMVELGLDPMHLGRAPGAVRIWLAELAPEMRKAEAEAALKYEKDAYALAVKRKGLWARKAQREALHRIAEIREVLAEMAKKEAQPA